ncbi:MAG: hypothetical protein ACLTF5_08505 [Butyricicoccus sp.]
MSIWPEDGLRQAADRLVSIMDAIPYTHYTGDPVNRRGTASFVFEAIEGEGLIASGSGRHLRLDRSLLDRPLDPLTCSWPSACPRIAHGSLRLTLGEQNTEEDDLIENVTKVVETLRAMSPVWVDGKPDLTAASDLRRSPPSLSTFIHKL